MKNSKFRGSTGNQKQAEVALTGVRGAAYGAKIEEDGNKGPAGKMNIQVETEAKPLYAVSTKKENAESK
ncbi:hypothetical protein U1Q18_043493 [Sarracenia purpurea var. burkii]